jgi:hypothetical protein
MHFSRIWKVREGKLETFKDWMNQLGGTRRDEALATFEFEHVTREVFVLFPGKDGTQYVVAMNETTEGDPLPSDKSVAINVEHRAILLECLEPITEKGEILIDLKL